MYAEPHRNRQRMIGLIYFRTTGKLLLALMWTSLTIPLAIAQQTPPTPLRIVTDVVPQVSVNQPYRFRFEAAGGVAPYGWKLIGGDLPPGLVLDDTGGLIGRATKVGEFRFVIKLTDSAAPPNSITKEFVVRIYSPLVLEWVTYPRVLGARVDGIVKVTNGSKDDFDLTVIIMAVNEIGRATALGYQRLNLKAGVADLQIPFGLDMPPGSYVVHADAIAEVPAKNAIYRQRLQTTSPVTVAVGP